MGIKVVDDRNLIKKLETSVSTPQAHRQKQRRPAHPKFVTDIETLKKLEGEDGSVSGTVKSFFHAGMKNIDEYGASAAKLFGADDLQKHFNERKRKHEARITNRYADFIGGMLLDPVNFAPAGIVSKGSKLARVGKSMAAGAAVGGATMAAKNYGDERMGATKKRNEIGQGAAFVSVLNGVIAALTKGKVKDAITSPEHLQTEEAKAAIEALTKNPEAFGLKSAEAENVRQEYLRRLKELQWTKTAQKEASRMYSVLHNGKRGTTVSTPGGDVGMTAEFADKMRKKHLDDPVLRGMVTTKEAISFPKVAKHVDRESGRHGDTWRVEADDGLEIVYGSGHWDGSEKLKTIHSKTEKGGRGQPHREFNDRDFHDSALHESIIPQNDPLARWALELARERKVTDMRSPQRLLAKRAVRHENSGKGYETRVTPALYEKNHDYGFRLTASDVKKVESGKMTPEIEEKLRHDVGLLENHPDYRDEAREIREGAETLFSGGDSLAGNFFTNGGINLATGAGVGTLNATDTMMEGGSDDEIADSFVRGLLAGAVGVEGIRLLRKTNPKAYEKMRRFVAEHFSPDGTAKDPEAVRAFMSRAEKKEKRGIYNVTFNDKKSTVIYKDADFADSVIKYERGKADFIDNRGKKRSGFGALHIEKHLGKDKDGWVTENELLNIGNAIRNTEPKIGRDGKRVYEYYNDDGVRFRIIVGDKKNGERTISFFSNRKAGFGNDSQNYIYNRPSNNKTISQDDGGVKLGMFAGSRAKGWKEARAAGRTFEGKYDGMERFEIDDSQAVLNEEALPKRVGEFADLGDVLKHDELYRNYPELKSVKVGIDTSFGRGDAEFSPYANGGEGVIFVSKHGTDRNVLLHEIQHKLQEIEGFARGGSVEEQLAKIDGELKNLAYEIDTTDDPFKKARLQDRLKELEERYRDSYAAAYERYQKMAGEIEARDVEARMDYTPQERAEAKPYSSENIPPEDAEVVFRGDPRKLGGYEGDVVFHRREGMQVGGKLSHIEKLVEKTVNKEWEDISRSLKNDFKRLFSNTLSGEYLAKRDIAMAERNKVAKKAETLHYALRQLPEEERRVLHEYIVGDVSDAPEHLRKIAHNIRATVKEMTEKLVDDGILPKEAVEEWGEYYLRRRYEKYFLKDIVSSASKKMTMEKIFGRGKVETVSKKRYEEMVANGEIDSGMVGRPLREGGIRIRELPNGKVEIKRDWTKAEREAMGEITDAAVTVPETMIYLSQLLEHSKFLKEIKAIDGAVITPDDAKLFGKEALEKSGYVRLDSSPKYGVLAGQWVRADVADDIRGINDNVFDTFFGSDNGVAKAWKWYLRNWKKAKTVWNAPTHFNNLTSNMFLMHLAGLNPVEIGRYFSRSVSMMRSAGKMKELEQRSLIGSASPEELKTLERLKAMLGYYIEAENIGLLNQSHLQDVLQGHVDGFVERSRLGKVDDWVSNLYQAEDGVNKLAMFAFLRDRGWDVERARYAVESIMPDYNQPMPKGWRFLRDTGVSPFISWSYYTFPKIMRMVLSARGAFNAASALALMYGYSYYATGIANPWSDDLPDDFKASRLPIAKDGSTIHTLKVDRMNPYLQFLHPYNYFQETFSGVTTQIPFTMRGIQMYNGRPITYDGKPKAQQAYDIGKHVVQNYTPIPQELNSLWNLAEASVRSKKNRKTGTEVLPRTKGQEILKLLGLNTLSYDKASLKRKRH